jgi:hypothetical protein
MDADALREGIYALNTRRFGSVAEVLVKKLADFGKAQNQFHDLYCDLHKKRVEVKFSRALKKSEIPITEQTILQCIEGATSERRLVKWEDRRAVKFDCNIQQVKRVEFDELYYGIFFADCVVIFNIESGDIGSHIYYSDRQHKGNTGEGQFHVNQDTIKIHEDKYFYRRLAYPELYNILRVTSE